MTYDIKFCTLAASYPRDIRHLDTWVECISMPKSQPEHWPCPHCGSMYHYPQRRHFRACSFSTDANTQLPITGHAPPPASTHNLHTCPQQPQSLSPICKRAVSSAMFAMDHILNMLARPLKWDSLPLGIDNWGACTPLRPLALECELCNHPEKAFIQLLLSDIRQGHNIGYT